MSELMSPIPFRELMTWVTTEYQREGSVFGVHRPYKAGVKKLPIFGETIETPFGPAAGPNTQLAQNIIASYFGGARFFELKTVQKMDGADLAACINRPCILAEDECYNCEWSTELYVQQAFEEYVKAWCALKIMAKVYGLGDPNGFVFNMSVGYDLAGIQADKVNTFLDGMVDASKTPIFQECIAVLKEFFPGESAYIDTITPHVSGSVTVSTLHGCTPDEMLPFYGDLAAIGTIADIMLLEGENRRIVKAGLALLQQTERPGIAALIEACGLGGKELTAENVSFGLAPRLNAAGRMDSAAAALELLLCEDPEEAEAIVAGLEAQNAARQKAEQDILQGVLDSVAADETYGADRILVVWGRGYHQGVIGIVASRVVERFGKPAIIVSVDENGEGKGSGRSIAGVSLYNAIAACGDLLIRFGGHALAAGLSVREENLPAFRKAVNAWAAQEHPVLKRPALRLDAPLALSGLKEEDVAALSVLAPFGHGNPTPVFFVENAVIDAVYPLSEGKHTRLRLKQGGGVLYAAVFGQGPGALGYNVGDAVDAAVCLSVFEGKNGPMISARIKELRPAGLDEAYLEGTELYEALMCGAPLTESQRRALLPARADTVALYRAVGAARDGVPAGDLRPLFAKLGARGAGKALVSLEALRELSLLEQRETPQGARWCLVPAAGKKDLASAPILRRLEAAQ